MPYDHHRTPLEARIDLRDTTDADWVRGRISFAKADDRDRVHMPGTATSPAGSARRLTRLPAVFLAIAGLSTLWLIFSEAADFHVYWAAGRDLRLGGWDTVYQISTLTPFKYHPAFAMLMVPWGLLPFLAAKLLWAVVNGLAILDLQQRWRARWEFDVAAIGIGCLGVAHALTWEFLFANVTFLMLWLWTVAATSEHPWRQAICYGVLIALKPFWLILVGPWLLARRWGTFGRVLAVLAALSLLPAVLGPHSLAAGYERWFATFTDPLHAHNYPKNDNQTWYALLFRHREALGGTLRPLWVAGSAAVGLLWLWGWRDAIRRPVAAESWWRLDLTIIPVMLWAAPLSWIHHQILLWPLMALLWQRGRTNPSARAVWVVTFLLTNATAQFVLGRPHAVAAHQWGLPILAFPLLAWWAARSENQCYQPGEGSPQAR